MNKAKVAWLQDQFKIQELENELNAVALQLKSLNGDEPITFASDTYENSLKVSESDSIWQEKLGLDPSLLMLEQEKLIAQQSLKLAKIKRFRISPQGLTVRVFLGSDFQVYMLE